MKDDQDTPATEPTARRQFLKLAGAAVASAGFGADALAANPAAGTGTVAAVDPAPALRGATTAPAAPPAGYNILFILTDQERHFDRWPFPVPGREALRRDGITFMHHQIAACVCSPSRSTVYTGQHIQHTGVLDNAGLP
ncbi:hypothetical protein [Burkholderia cenocepacia]|nr:hypothetical protein [Burkholderia cenocepacia]